MGGSHKPEEASLSSGINQIGHSCPHRPQRPAAARGRGSGRGAPSAAQPEREAGGRPAVREGMGLSDEEEARKKAASNVIY